MRRGWSGFMLLCLLAMGAKAEQISRLSYVQTVSLVTGQQEMKPVLAAYLSSLFGKGVYVEKGCLSISLPSDSLFQPHSDRVKTDTWANSIDTVALIGNRYPRTDIIVSAFTDSLHSEEQNLALSELQAWMIKKALVDKGVAARKIRARGWGESKPVASNATDDGRKANRRITISFGPACAHAMYRFTKQEKP
ncbi:MAG: OmpA family protein [Syntrophobacteraceae bacterium]|nr:OmpA family protein [Syntrophobacteraceae bacterium]